MAVPHLRPGRLLGNTAAAHATSAIIISPFSWWSSTRLGRGNPLGPLPPRTLRRGHRRIVPYRRSNGVGVQDDWGWSGPGILLGVLSPPLSEGRPPLAVSRSSRGWPARLSSGHTWEARMWCAIAGTGACSRLSPRVSGPQGGVTPAVHLRGPAPLAASPAQPVSESGKCLQNSRCPDGRGEQTPTPVPCSRRKDGHIGAF